MTATLEWRTPKVQELYDAFHEPEEWDAQRMLIEESMLGYHHEGVNMGDADALMDATHRWMVDMIDMGHYPSRYMLQLINGTLKALLWPGHKQAKRTEDAAWLFAVCVAIEQRAKAEYGDASGARTRAKEDIAKKLGLANVQALDRTLRRVRKRLEEREAEVKRKRDRDVERQRRREAILEQQRREVSEGQSAVGMKVPWPKSWPE
jgi:hypothetical protein